MICGFLASIGFGVSSGWRRRGCGTAPILAICTGHAGGVQVGAVPGNGTPPVSLITLTGSAGGVVHWRGKEQGCGDQNVAGLTVGTGHGCGCQVKAAAAATGFCCGVATGVTAGSTGTVNGAGKGADGVMGVGRPAIFTVIFGRTGVTQPEVHAFGDVFGLSSGEGGGVALGFCCSGDFPLICTQVPPEGDG